MDDYLKFSIEFGPASGIEFPPRLLYDLIRPWVYEGNNIGSLLGLRGMPHLVGILLQRGGPGHGYSIKLVLLYELEHSRPLQLPYLHLNTHPG